MKSFTKNILISSLLVFFIGISSAFATKYYVSVATGSNSNTSSDAQSSATPWQTLAFAITQAANGDSVVVLPGTYGETNLIIDKQLKLFGNETTGLPGSGTKPVFNGTSGTGSASIFILQANSIVIRNFEIHVNQADVIRGIYCSGPGYNKLQVLDNHIFSSSTLAPTIFNSYGIQLGSTSLQANQDSFIIARNIIRPLTPGSALFGRGIRLVGGFGLIGGAQADSNIIAGDYAIQAGDIKSRLQVMNNHLFGTSAGLELNIPAANRTHTISGNKFEPNTAFNSLSMIELKNNTLSNSIIQISGNQFIGHPISAIFSTRSRNVVVDGNTFIPSDTSQNYIHIAVNNKQQTTANDAATASSITITGNDFRGNSAQKGTAISFQNHNSGVNPPFTNTTIGGAGVAANTFSAQIGRFVMLDTASGLSTQNPLWNQAVYKVTLMRPVNQGFNLAANAFDLGSGAQLPTAMSEATLMQLENRILHGVDFDSLGFVMVKDQSVFVTQQSFLPPVSTTPSLQRAINQVGSTDGFTLLAETGTYPGRAKVSTTLALDVTGELSIGTGVLEMSGSGKVLSINNTIQLSDSLKLTSGKIALASANLEMQSGAFLSGGSSTNYVQTNGAGQFRYAVQIGAPQVYPVGTATSFLPLTIRNAGSFDQLGIRVQPDVLSGGLAGTPVDSVVGATWVVSEGLPGGSDLTITASWPSATEKPFFNRANTHMQGYSTRWNTISNPPVAAAGTDPYSATYTGISTVLSDLALRIRTISDPLANSKLYYVDDNTGSDTRTNTEAKDPTTPWQTIAKALASCASGDSIQVLAGTYTEFDLLVNKSLTILGNVSGVGVGVGAGTGIRPVVNGIGPSPLDSSIFIVRATNVNLRNFNIKVDIDKIKLGINAPVTGFSGLIIEDNLIESTAEFVSGGIDVVVLSHAILLGRLTGATGNGNDSIIVRRNIINREGATKKWFSRGVRWWGGKGMIGGFDPADGNEVHADFAVQCGGGNIGGRLQTRNNTIFGRAAGVEYNTPPPTYRHTIANNTIRPLDLNGHFALVEIKSNIRVTGPTSPVPPFIDIENNSFLDFYKIGVALTRSRKCNVMNNTFTPLADSTNYTHVWVNSKQRTAGSAASQAPLAVIETLIQGNLFNSNNVFGGYGVAFQNANVNATGKVFTVNDMGGAGSLANTFGVNIAKVVYLDTITGPSSDDAFWSKPGINWTAWPSTPTGPVRDNFDFSGNLYDVGSGPKRPDAMTTNELFLLENRVVHKIDADTLGVVTMKANHVFVTQQSFIAPLTTTPRLQRAANSTAADGYTINIETGIYNGTTTVRRSTTFDATPDGQVASEDLGMAGTAKVLTLTDPFRITGSLRLDSGLVDIGSNDLTLASAATVAGGSISSHIQTSGSGYFVYENLGATVKKYPVGTGSKYVETNMSNTGTSDNIGLKVTQDVLASGLSGAVVDTVVATTYQLRETTQGASNLNFSPTWAAADERPFFNRNLVFIEQFNSGWQNIGPATPSPATGTDPFTITAGISGNWNEQAIRIIGRSPAVAPSGNLYYVDDNTGLDTRTNAEAKNPNTPWQTIGKALASVANQDSIQVFDGTYSEANLTITKSVKLLGNVVGVGAGAGQGTGTKPLVNGTSGTPSGSIFILQSDSVLLQNFDIRVNQNDVIRGIFSNGPGFNKLRVLDNHIFSTSTLAPSIFNSYGIQLGTTSIGAGLDSFLIARNVIQPLNSSSALFGRGIRLLGGYGMIGGSLASDSNRIMGDYGIQSGDIKRRFQLLNNHIFGRSAALELNVPAANQTHTISGNVLNPVPGSISLSMIEIKNNRNANSIIRISGNQIAGHQVFGILSTRSQNVMVDGNTFIPSDTSLNYGHIVVNTKQQTTANDASVASGIHITGNNFQGNSFLKGTAIAFQNHNSGAVPAFTNTVIGGAGLLANTFTSQVGRFLMLDTASGPSSQNPLWNQAGYKVTLMRPVSVDFDVKENLYDIGSGGPTLPNAMTESNLLALENRLIHGVDYDSLGFLTVKNQAVFVTQNSFISPLTTVSKLQRAINQVGTNDGWTLLAESGTYQGRAQVSTDLTLDVVNDLSCSTNTLQMNGAGKSLTLNNDFYVSDSLKLTAGRVMLTTGNLQMQTGAILEGGSINSYIHTNGIGEFRHQNQGAASRLYPVGTAARYFPLAITNSGTADELGIRVQADVLNGGLTGTPVDSVVAATWVATEGNPGGSNLNVTATWGGVDEKPFFNRTQAFLQGFTGSWSNVSPTAVAANGSDPYSALFAGVTSSMTSLPLRISSAQPQSAGNLYYVDNVTGLDTRTNAEAKDPTTPWKTIGKSLASTVDGDSIQVFSGNYSESNLRITHSLKIFGSVLGIGIGAGAGTGIRPVVNGTTFGSDSSIFIVQASNVLINNFQIEVEQNVIIHGIVAKTANYDRVEIRNNRILSAGINPLPPSIPCLRFNTYGIRLVGFSTDSLLIQGNVIEPSALDGSRCVFGRGIKLFGGHGLIGGPNDLDSNRILAFYAMQAGDIDGGRLIVENNFTVGIGLQIVAPAANSGIHVVRGNNFFCAFPQFFPTLLELRDIQNVGTGVLATQNNFVGYSNTAIFSQRSQNVQVLANNFQPSDTARNYRDVVVNTKQETLATTQNPVPNSINIKSNNFKGNARIGAGTAIEFGNHNDDPNSVNAFTNVSIGGLGAEANTFNIRIGKYFVLDPLNGASNSIPYWSNVPPTPMAPVRDTFDISNNSFAVSGGTKLPSVMSDDELFELEDKVSHRIDYDSLGFVKWKAAFAFVTDSSFLRPYRTSPSIQRAVDAASSDGWQVNIKPVAMGETTNVDKTITFNTHPADSIRLGGINMNGLDKILTLSDKFVLTNALTLNNPNGGKIKIGDNDLNTLPSTTVTAGSLNSYVMTNGTGSLIRRGVDDQEKNFPVGTVDSYAPVLFDDANNTGDNFKVKVRPAATNADFGPPLPLTINTFVKFQWDICEAIAGGTSASITFDWVDPANVNGAGILNAISRFDGTNWTPFLATIGPGLTARYLGFSEFCAGFAVVADPTLTSITTANIIKVHPAVAGKFCIGDSIRIPFTVQGTGIITGNAFNAFLSDADGTFPATGGVLIGSMLGQTSDTIIGVIPVSTPVGSNYHVRVVSTNIAITGIANPDSIKVFGLPARPTVTTADSVLCNGESTTLSSSLATGYLWNPGGQITQDIIVSIAGAYKVRISDVNGCTNTSAPRNVIVNTSPVADTISYVQPLARCIGDSLLLTANPAGLSYIWLNTAPVVTSQTLTVKTSGTYQVAVSNGTCSDTSTALVVNFNPLPVKPIASISNTNDTICQPGLLNFTTASTGFQYEWVITGVTPNPTTQNTDVGTPGIYSGTVTITDANGCKNTSDAVQGQIKQTPARPVIRSLDGDLSKCEGENIQLETVPFTSSNTYTWQPGGFVGSPFVVSNPGQVTVSVSVDSLGCKATNLLDVSANISARPVAPTAAITSGQNSFCSGDSAVLTSSPALGYLWTPGSFNTQSITVKASGNYSLVALSDSGCASLPSAAIAIDVRKSPAVPLILATKTVFCFGEESTISVTNPVAGNTYTWTPSGTGTSIVVTSSGNYSVKVDSANNCSSVSSVIGITVNPLPEPVITAIGGKPEACQGEAVVLYSNYQTGNVWSNNATTDTVKIKTTLGITLTVTDLNSCSSTAGPVQVIIHSLPKVNLLQDTAVVFPETVVLVAQDISNSAEQYLWSSEGQLLATTTVPTQEIAPSKTATYFVTLVDTNGCKALDSVLVRVNRELYVPNVFSPNGDGKNDRFKVYGFGVVSIEVKIWDRLGQLVYETTDQDEIVETALDENSVKGWDGKYKGKELGQESYIWSVKGKLTTGEDVKVTGGKNSGSVIIMN